jgi:hypothetical protein
MMHLLPMERNQEHGGSNSMYSRKTTFALEAGIATTLIG